VQHNILMPEANIVFDSSIIMWTDLHKAEFVLFNASQLGFNNKINIFIFVETSMQVQRFMETWFMETFLLLDRWQTVIIAVCQRSNSPNHSL